MQVTTIGRVWFVKGDEYHTPFDTKNSAELMARHLFPDEDAAKRYARVFYRDVMRCE